MSKKIKKSEDIVFTMMNGEDNSTKKNKKGKKKCKKKSGNYKEKYFKNKVVTEWEDIKSDIEKMQKKINDADKKKDIDVYTKKNSKKIRFTVGSTTRQVRVRKGIIELFRDSMFLDSVVYVITKSKSMAKVIAKMFCLLVISLMSIDCVKKLIPDKLFNKIDNVFQIAASI